MSRAPLILAIPSKGRIQEGCLTYFARAGLPINGADGRDYSAKLSGVENVEIVLATAAEIPAMLATGAAHLGVTGEDLIREKVPSAEDSIALALALGFAKANVVVAAPRSWIDVSCMRDLDEVCIDFHKRHGRRLRVATKYLELTRNFFAGQGLSDYLIVESLGATEGAPAAGAAEVIVDITETGSTLVANNLKILDDGVILQSEAQLAASISAPWSAHAKAALRHMLDMFAATARARDTKIVRYYAAKPLGAAAKLLEKLGCIFPDPDCAKRKAEWIEFYCPSASLYDTTRVLREKRIAELVTVDAGAYLFLDHNPLYDALAARLA
jgi:ATP phosphoribosyltransferase